MITGRLWKLWIKPSTFRLGVEHPSHYTTLPLLKYHMNLASVSSFPPLQLMVVPLQSLPPVSVCFLGGLRDRKRGKIHNTELVTQ